MNDYELEDRIKELYKNKTVDDQLVEEILSHINYLEEELEECDRQRPYY